MTPASAVLTGAGISMREPAGLPLGDAFHEALLRGCFDAANRAVEGRLSRDGLRSLMTGGRRNILGCIEDCLDEGSVTAVLDCMRVSLPTEEHMLCAVLAARGIPQLTLNFDNGIELAYALLTGSADLPADVPRVYRDALNQWRKAMPPAPPLLIVAIPRLLARRQLTRRPVLIKLRGSVNIGADGTVVPLRPAVEDLESNRLDDDRLHALREAVAGGHLLITGHSGRDLDVFESLLTLLRPGGFTWVTPELDPTVAARLRAIDPRQPRRGQAVPALRAQLPTLPPWPAVAIHGVTFTDRFSAWWRTVPKEAAAEGYAWMLSDAGRHDDAIGVLRAIASGSSQARLRVRLADALDHRGGQADLDEGVALLLQAALRPGTAAGLRAYALTRWVETRTARHPSPTRLLTGVACGALAVAAASTGAGRQRVATRCLSGVAQLGVHHVDARIAGALPSAGRRAAALLVAYATRLMLALAWHRAGRAGTRTRQTDLELLRLRNALHLAILRRVAPPGDTRDRLAAIERAHAHRGNRAGVLRAGLTRALTHLAYRDAHRFGESMRALENPNTAHPAGPRVALHAAQLHALSAALNLVPKPNDVSHAASASTTMSHPFTPAFVTDSQPTG